MNSYKKILCEVNSHATGPCRALIHTYSKLCSILCSKFHGDDFDYTIAEYIECSITTCNNDHHSYSYT